MIGMVWHTMLYTHHTWSPWDSRRETACEAAASTLRRTSSSSGNSGTDAECRRLWRDVAASADDRATLSRVQPATTPRQTSTDRRDMLSMWRCWQRRLLQMYCRWQRCLLNSHLYNHKQLETSTITDNLCDDFSATMNHLHWHLYLHLFHIVLLYLIQLLGYSAATVRQNWVCHCMNHPFVIHGRNLGKLHGKLGVCIYRARQKK